jgi:hypothetical protein
MNPLENKMAYARRYIDITPSGESERAREAALIAKVNQVVWFLAGVIETLLLLRFVFRALGAAASPFTIWLYDVAPFQGIFPSPSGDGMVLDLATIVAMVVTVLVASIITSLLNILRPARAI